MESIFIFVRVVGKSTNFVFAVARCPYREPAETTLSKYGCVLLFLAKAGIDDEVKLAKLGILKLKKK